MAETARRLADWSDVLATPEGVEAEVLAGELWTSPRPRPLHAFVQVGLSHDLVGSFQRGSGGPGGWWILVEPDVAFGPHDIVSPDLVGWRRERVPTFPDEHPIGVRPDWVCEVLSPSTVRRDRAEKSELYLRSGVPHYWLIDPEGRLLEALEARDGAWVRLGAWGDGDRARVPPFDAVELEIAALFPPAEPAGSAEPADPAD